MPTKNQILNAYCVIGGMLGAGVILVLAYLTQ